MVKTRGKVAWNLREKSGPKEERIGRVKKTESFTRNKIREYDGYILLFCASKKKVRIKKKNRRKNAEEKIFRILR